MIIINKNLSRTFLLSCLFAAGSGQPFLGSILWVITVLDPLSWLQKVWNFPASIPCLFTSLDGQISISSSFFSHGTEDCEDEILFYYVFTPTQFWVSVEASIVVNFHLSYKIKFFKSYLVGSIGFLFTMAKSEVQAWHLQLPFLRFYCFFSCYYCFCSHGFFCCYIYS